MGLSCLFLLHFDDDGTVILSVIVCAPSVSLLGIILRADLLLATQPWSFHLQTPSPPKRGRLRQPASDAKSLFAVPMQNIDHYTGSSNTASSFIMSASVSSEACGFTSSSSSSGGLRDISHTYSIQRWLAGEAREDLALLFRRCEGLATQPDDSPPDHHQAYGNAAAPNSATVDTTLLAFIGAWAADQKVSATNKIRVLDDSFRARPSADQLINSFSRQHDMKNCRRPALNELCHALFVEVAGDTGVHVLLKFIVYKGESLGAAFCRAYSWKRQELGVTGQDCHH